MPGNPIDPGAVLTVLEEVRAETLRRLHSLTQEELDTRPGTSCTDSGVDEWSLGEVFMARILRARSWKA